MEIGCRQGCQKCFFFINVWRGIIFGIYFAGFGAAFGGCFVCFVRVLL